MYKFINFLREHPGWGMFSSVGGALQTLIETSTPVLQFLGLLIGLAIGILTVLAKWRELTKGRNL